MTETKSGCARIVRLHETVSCLERALWCIDDATDYKRGGAYEAARASTFLALENARAALAAERSR